MTNEEYLGAQNAIQQIGALVEPHDWSAFLERINQAETISPLTIPDDYRRAADTLRAIKAVAFDLVPLKMKFHTLRGAVAKRDGG